MRPWSGSNCNFDSETLRQACQKECYKKDIKIVLGVGSRVAGIRRAPRAGSSTWLTDPILFKDVLSDSAHISLGTDLKREPGVTQLAAPFVPLREEGGRSSSVREGVCIGFLALFRFPRTGQGHGGCLNSENWCLVNKMEVLSQNRK